MGIRRSDGWAFWIDGWWQTEPLLQKKALYWHLWHEFSQLWFWVFTCFYKGGFPNIVLATYRMRHNLNGCDGHLSIWPNTEQSPCFWLQLNGKEPQLILVFGNCRTVFNSWSIYLYTEMMGKIRPMSQNALERFNIWYNWSIPTKERCVLE